jgi:hypothetical protein
LLNADEKNVFEAVVVWSETQCVKKNIEVNDKNLIHVSGKKYIQLNCLLVLMDKNRTEN